MAKSREQKQETVNQLQNHVAKQQAIVFVSYKGLPVADLTSLRAKLGEVGSKLIVAKKTLLEKVMKEQGIEAGVRNMEGQVAAIFAHEDPIAPIKTAHTFGKQNEHFTLLGGYFENELHDATSITAIATLPSREELLAKLVGTMAAPISGFATVLQGNIKGLLIALNAISKQQTSNK